LARVDPELFIHSESNEKRHSRRSLCKITYPSAGSDRISQLASLTPSCASSQS